MTNAGSLPWSEQVFLASHWLDDRDNPIVWDGPRNDVPPLAPGESASRRGDGSGCRSRPAVTGSRSTWSPSCAPGSPSSAARCSRRRRRGRPARRRAERGAARAGVEPAPDWAERVRAAHAEGFGGRRRRDRRGPGRCCAGRRATLAPYAPGPGRVPGFSPPLLCPSVLPGIELEPLADVAGLPAFAAPQDEPWVYDGRIVLRVRRLDG